MESLSSEIVELIFRKLDVISLVQSSSVCHQWRNYTTNWRLWQAFYFERWTHFKNDHEHKKAIGDQWRSLYCRMHAYSRDILCLNEVPLANNVKRFIEEVLISPYVLNKNCLYNGTGSGYFYKMADLFKNNEDKNELFSIFLYDLNFIANANHPSFTEEFLKVLTAAQARGKKIVLMVNDFDNTPVGTNPIISDPKLANEFIQIVNNYRDDIILMIYSNYPYVITEPFVKLFASCKVNLVHLKHPDEAARKELLLTRIAILGNNDNRQDTLSAEIDHDVIAKASEGANADDINEIINRAFRTAIRRVLEIQPEGPVHVVVTTDDVMQTINYSRDQRQPNKPFHSAILDADNVKILRNMVNLYPDDLKLISI